MRSREDRQELARDLAAVLNRHSWEGEAGDTPDFVLAEMLVDFLDAYGEAVGRRDMLQLGGPVPELTE